MMFLVAVQCVALQTPSAPPAAQVAPALTAPVAAPAAAPDAEAKAAHRLVEVKANSKKNLEAALATYERALATGALSAGERVRALNDMARAHLRLADLLRGEKTRIAEYTRGKRRAEQASALDPKNADAMFWQAATGACIGREKGILNAAAGVGPLKKKLREALAKNPNHHYARDTLAKVYHTVPGLMGGDDDKAEALFKEVLRRDPNFTPTMVSYGQFLIDDDRDDEARAMLQRVVNMKRSSVPHDWRKFNKPAAQRMLKKMSE